MTNFANFLENTNSSRRLYRVWVPLYNDGKAPLICIWIDPSMAGFESEPCQEGAGIPAEEGSCANICAIWIKPADKFQSHDILNRLKISDPHFA